jgi:hypothetical protein
MLVCDMLPSPAGRRNISIFPPAVQAATGVVLAGEKYLKIYVAYLAFFATFPRL